MIKEKNILQNNPKSSLTKIQRKISTTQIILIVSLSLVLGILVLQSGTEPSPLNLEA